MGLKFWCVQRTQSLQHHLLGDSFVGASLGGWVQTRLQRWIARHTLTLSVTWTTVNHSCRHKRRNLPRFVNIYSIQGNRIIWVASSPGLWPSYGFLRSLIAHPKYKKCKIVWFPCSTSCWGFIPGPIAGLSTPNAEMNSSPHAHALSQLD